MNTEVLTIRQQQVVSLLLTGMSNKEIARALNLSEGTIKLHLNQAYSRLKVTTRAKLIALHKASEESA